MTFPVFAAQPSRDVASCFPTDRWRLFWSAAFCVLSGLQLLAIWTHDPWTDELHAIVLAQASQTPADWYWNFRYEGHPPLWHLLLKAPLLSGADPILALRLTITPLALGTTWLIALRSPLSPVWRWLLAANYFLLFEYGVIARGYGLGVFVFLAAIACYRHRIGWIFICLTPAGGLQFAVMAAILCVIAWKHGNRSRAGLAAACIFIVLAFVWIHPQADYLSEASPGAVYSLWALVGRALLRAGNVVSPLDWFGDSLIWSSRVEATSLLAGLVLPVLAVFSVGPRSGHRLFVGLLLAITFSVAIWSYSLSARHYGLIFVLCAGLVWIEAGRGSAVSILFRIWVAVLGIEGVVATVQATTTSFSSTAAVRDWIAQNGETNSFIMPLPPLLGAEITAFTRRPTYDVTQGCMQPFTRMRRPTLTVLLRDRAGADAEASPAGGDVLLAEAREAARRSGGRVLIFSDAKNHAIIEAVGATDVRLLTEFPGGDARIFERFVHEVMAPPDPQAKPLPICVDPRDP